MADKPVLDTISGSRVYSADKLNGIFDDLAVAIEGCVGRGGTAESPNSMAGDLDMNLNKIINLDDPTNDGDAANKSYVDTSIAAIPGVGGGGAVDSVNSQTGVVVLDTGDIADTVDARYVTDNESAALAGTGTPSASDPFLSQSNAVRKGPETDLKAYAVAGVVTQTEFELALAAAQTTAGGGVLNIGAITLSLDSGQIDITSPVTIRGTNATSSILQTSTDNILFNITANDVKFENIRIRHITNTAAAGAAFKVSNAAVRFVLRNCIVQDFYDNFDFAKASTWTLDDSYLITPVRYNVWIGSDPTSGDTGDQKISNCTFDDNAAKASGPAAAAIRWEAGGGLKVTNTKILHHNYSVDYYYSDDVTPDTSIFICNGNSLEGYGVAAVRIARSGSTEIFGKIILSNCQLNNPNATSYTFDIGVGVYNVNIVGNNLTSSAGTTFARIAGNNVVLEANSASGCSTGVEFTADSVNCLYGSSNHFKDATNDYTDAGTNNIFVSSQEDLLEKLREPVDGAVLGIKAGPGDTSDTIKLLVEQNSDSDSFTVTTAGKVFIGNTVSSLEPAYLNGSPILSAATAIKQDAGVKGLLITDGNTGSNIVASNISVSDVDNSYNSASAGFPLLPVNSWITVSGFSNGANNGSMKVLSSTTSKIVVDKTLVTEAAGASITIIRRLQEFVVGWDTTLDYADIYAIRQGIAYRNIAVAVGGGNVGIGTSSPAQKLDVNGSLQLSGNLTDGTNSAAIEDVISAGAYAPHDVVNLAGTDTATIGAVNNVSTTDGIITIPTPTAYGQEFYIAAGAIGSPSGTDLVPTGTTVFVYQGTEYTSASGLIDLPQYTMLHFIAVSIAGVPAWGVV